MTRAKDGAAAEVTVRDAGAADLSTIAALFVSAGMEAANCAGVSIEDAWHRLRAEVPGSRVLLAERAAIPVGTLTFVVVPSLSHRGAPAALVESVAVAADAQGHGVGRALMEAAMHLAREAGCYKVALSSNVKRDKAHAFYEHLGYAVHGLSFAVMLDAAPPAP